MGSTIEELAEVFSPLAPVEPLFPICDYLCHLRLLFLSSVVYDSGQWLRNIAVQMGTRETLALPAMERGPTDRDKERE